MKKAATGESGFTLIEVLVALVILSFAIVASIQGFAQGLRLLSLAGDHQEAILLADQKLRELVEVKEGNDQGTEGRFTWQRAQTQIEAPDLVPAVGIPLWRLFQIDVRVNWGTQRHVELRTLRMVPIVTGPTGATGANPATQGGAQTPGTAGRPGTTGSGGTSLPIGGGRPSGGGGGFPGLPR